MATSDLPSSSTKDIKGSKFVTRAGSEYAISAAKPSPNE